MFNVGEMILILFIANRCHVWRLMFVEHALLSDGVIWLVAWLSSLQQIMFRGKERR